MNTTKNRKRKKEAPETIEVVIPAASLLDVLRRYKKINWPVTVTIRDGSRGGRLFFLRSREEIVSLQRKAADLQVAYFRRVRGELVVDLADKARVTVRRKTFRKARNATLLAPSEVIRYFLYRTGDRREPS